MYMRNLKVVQLFSNGFFDFLFGKIYICIHILYSRPVKVTPQPVLELYIGAGLQIYKCAIKRRREENLKGILHFY
jgi:hypothetical protein